MTYTGSGEPAVSAPYPAPGQPPAAVPSHGSDFAAIGAGYGPPPGPPPGPQPDQPGRRPGPPPVPEPPQGPGVTPPFAVPPTEGRSSRLWVGIGIGALVAVLVCGGGIAAIIGLATTGTRALNEQIEVVVGDYFEAVQQKRYNDAYGQLCEDVQEEESAADFTRRVSAEPVISRYDIGSLSAAAIDLAVPVDVVYADGAADTLRVFLAQDGSTGAFEVCGVER
jgi:hypothetical protein